MHQIDSKYLHICMIKLQDYNCVARSYWEVLNMTRTLLCCPLVNIIQMVKCNKNEFQKTSSKLILRAALSQTDKKLSIISKRYQKVATADIFQYCPKVTKFLRYIYKKIFGPKFLKIVQSGHTGPHYLKIRQIICFLWMFAFIVYRSFCPMSPMHSFPH